LYLVLNFPWLINDYLETRHLGLVQWRGFEKHTLSSLKSDEHIVSPYNINRFPIRQVIEQRKSLTWRIVPMYMCPQILKNYIQMT